MSSVFTKTTGFLRAISPNGSSRQRTSTKLLSKNNAIFNEDCIHNKVKKQGDLEKRQTVAAPSKDDKIASTTVEKRNIQLLPDRSKSAHDKKCSTPETEVISERVYSDANIENCISEMAKSWRPKQLKLKKPLSQKELSATFKEEHFNQSVPKIENKIDYEKSTKNIFFKNDAMKENSRVLEATVSKIIKENKIHLTFDSLPDLMYYKAKLNYSNNETNLQYRQEKIKIKRKYQILPHFVVLKRKEMRNKVKSVYKPTTSKTIKYPSGYASYKENDDKSKTIINRFIVKTIKNKRTDSTQSKQYQSIYITSKKGNPKPLQVERNECRDLPEDSMKYFKYKVSKPNVHKKYEKPDKINFKMQPIETPQTSFSLGTQKKTCFVDKTKISNFLLKNIEDRNNKIASIANPDKGITKKRSSSIIFVRNKMLRNKNNKIKKKKIRKAYYRNYNKKSTRVKKKNLIQKIDLKKENYELKKVNTWLENNAFELKTIPKYTEYTINEQLLIVRKGTKVKDVFPSNVALKHDKEVLTQNFKKEQPLMASLTTKYILNSEKPFSIRLGKRVVDYLYERNFSVVLSNTLNNLGEIILAVLSKEDTTSNQNSKIVDVSNTVVSKDFKSNLFPPDTEHLLLKIIIETINNKSEKNKGIEVENNTKLKQHSKKREIPEKKSTESVEVKFPCTTCNNGITNISNITEISNSLLMQDCTDVLTDLTQTEKPNVKPKKAISLMNIFRSISNISLKSKESDNEYITTNKKDLFITTEAPLGTQVSYLWQKDMGEDTPDKLPYIDVCRYTQQNYYYGKGSSENICERYVIPTFETEKEIKSNDTKNYNSTNAYHTCACTLPSHRIEDDHVFYPIVRNCKSFSLYKKEQEVPEFIKNLKR